MGYVIGFIVVCVIIVIVKDKIIRSANAECKVCGAIISSRNLHKICDQCRHYGHKSDLEK